VSVVLINRRASIWQPVLQPQPLEGSQ
jgi:hypothetical protein